MNRRKLIILFMFIIIILLIFTYFILKKYDNNETYDWKDIKEKIENKETLLLYLTNNECPMCDQINKTIDFYNKSFKTNFYIVNSDVASGKELEEYFDLSKNYFIYPSVIYINKGKWEFDINGIQFESELRNKLLDNNILDKKYNKIDNLINDDSFKILYSQSQKNIFLCYTYGSNGDNIRSKLFNLSQKYKFNYNVALYPTIDTEYIYNEVYNKVGNSFDRVTLIITRNNKIIDYLIPKGESDISKFLKDNKIY